MGEGPHIPRAVRLALAAFPRAFRDAHVAEMEEDYAEAHAVCATRRARFWLAVKTVFDALSSGLRERAATWKRERKNRRHLSFTDLLMRDVRQAVRGLLRRPGFALIAITTLALGIGANTAMFSVVNAVLLRPLSWVDPGSLVLVWAHREDPTARGDMSLPDIRDAASLPAVETLVGYRSMLATVTSGEEPELVAAARSTDGLMKTFRVRPFMGRDLTEQDNEQGRPRVVVIGHSYWRDRLGGRADVLGTMLDISEVPYEIVGVAPAGFDFPSGAQLWVPRWMPSGCGRSCHSLYAIGRLAGDATLEEFSAQLDVLETTLSAEYPDSNFGKRFRAIRLADDQVVDVRRGLWFVLGAVSLVLLIACANVANLLLVRSENRRGEVAVRRALGASRARLAAQVLMESAVLSIVGAAVGLGLARVAITLVRTTAAGAVPRIESASIDANVLLFTLGISTFVTLLFGLSPAWRQSRGSTAADLVSERRGGGGPRATRSRSLLLAAEVALSVLLLAGAALMLKSFDRLYKVELGFAPDRLAHFGVRLPYTRYDSLGKIVSFYERLEQDIAALPGVTAAASAFGPPTSAQNFASEVVVEGRPPAGPGAETYASMHPITPRYFETMRMPLVRGRRIEPSDRAGTLPVAVVSETFVRENFPDEDPIGKRFRMSADVGHGSPTWTLVGVVGDVRGGLTTAPSADVYFPLGQFGSPGPLTIVMRSAADSPPSPGVVRKVLRSIDARIPVTDYALVDDAIAASIAPARFYLVALLTFAGLAMVLACIGLYGVVAYIVAQRAREIGIRMALGARREQVVRMVLAQGLRPAIVGVTIGLGLALALGRIARSLLFEVSPRDPLILATVAGILCAVTLVACLLPALRASFVDPAVTLRDP